MRKRCRELDRELLMSFFNLLHGQYETLIECPANNGENGQAAVKKEAQRILSIAPDLIEWHDIYCLERAILQLESPAHLHLNAWSLENQFKRIGEDDYNSFQAYIACNGSPGTEAEKGRARVVKLREWLSWAYTARWILEEFRDQLTRKIAWLGGVFISLFLASAIWCFSQIDGGLDKSPAWLTLLMTAFAGIAGGMVSTLRRVQSAELNANTALTLIENERGFAWSILCSPFTGAVFAIILYAFFAGGLLTGALFPTIPFGSGDSPTKTNDLAKLIIWSFIAGFAERFVPDRLDQIIQQASPKQRESIKPSHLVPAVKAQSAESKRQNGNGSPGRRRDKAL